MYSVGEVAKKMGVPTSTIRFYDRQGLLPFVKRDKAERRIFSENDVNMLNIISCFKNGNVPIKDIAKFVQMCMDGDSTLLERYELINEELVKLKIQIDELQENYKFLQYKKRYFKTAYEAGTESIHFVPGTQNVQPDKRQQFENKWKSSDNPESLINFE
ncbi:MULTISPECIES: MerR family transcriptional regulator [Enterococcus]|uniref:MerR family transcriptional regulator n=1 Tax=Enterococcus TaxID=1350 RepID=UPI0002A1F9ED|nr:MULTISPECIES: MerR family transcriptional regulator [Enterococcus]ELB05490.1 hypothetical protein OIG_04371 [Enterococcus faecium EnGen0028]MDT6323799.1 MerR family transcriptional regulator [Enterococcus faecium]HAQ4672462.1 MerR family transcriptional regulator [Enterococcus faecium]HAQ4706611.1 MerR family transcriptional regulator [Enterococcus faecium]HAR1638577.1 MerR family transcriptional regulator [Enterococcus faecium]